LFIIKGILANGPFSFLTTYIDTYGFPELVELKERVGRNLQPVLGIPKCHTLEMSTSDIPN